MIQQPLALLHSLRPPVALAAVAAIPLRLSHRARLPQLYRRHRHPHRRRRRRQHHHLPPSSF